MNKVIIGITIVIILIAGIYLYEKDNIKAYPALKLMISTNLSSNETIQVSDITFEQTTVPFFYKRTDSIVKFPDVDANARIGNLMTEPVTYWASEYRNGDNGNYTLTLLFHDGEEPKINDTLLIGVALTDLRGRVVYKTTAFYAWI